MRPLDMSDIVNKASYVERLHQNQQQQPVVDQKLLTDKIKENAENRQDTLQETEEPESQDGNVIREKSRREKGRILKNREERKKPKNSNKKKNNSANSGDHIIDVTA